MAELKAHPQSVTGKLGKPAAKVQQGPDNSRAITKPLRDTTSLNGGAASSPAPLSAVVAKAQAAAAETQAPKAAEAPAPKAAETPAPKPAEAPAPKPAETPAPKPAEAAAPPKVDASLAIPGVPTGKDLPVVVHAAIVVRGTAKVSAMTDNCCEIQLHVKGKFLFKTIERDITVKLEKQENGTYLYRYKNEDNGETSEGVAKGITVDGNVRRLVVHDKKSGDDTPVTITDLGGGHFKISGDGFEADINKS